MTDASPLRPATDEPARLTLALVAHDARKDALVSWVGRNVGLLERAHLVATGTTGGRVADAHPTLAVTRLKSGPLGGDQQLGAMICEGRLHGMFFFIDPLSPVPHDVDVKALTRLATVYDLPFANSASTAQYVLEGLMRT